VALAENLGVKLVTADKQICKQFPSIAVSLSEFAG
jgi:predicted nucleic acid-binding protein